MMASAKSCSVSGCCKPHSRKGYCNGHYKRLWKYGDPLGGSTPKGEPMRFVNEVALRHTGDECLTWPYGRAKGYGSLYVDGKMVVVSRYICELVHGAPPTPEHEAAHSCGKGNEGCISPIHLDWKTHAANQADRVVHGTTDRGERQWQAKLTESAVREIRALMGKESQRNLANRLGVTRSNISAIHRAKSWAWLSEESRDAPSISEEQMAFRRKIGKEIEATPTEAIRKEDAA